MSKVINVSQVDVLQFYAPRKITVTIWKLMEYGNKNMLVCRHPGLFFRLHSAGRNFFFFNHFEMEKIALIFIYNIFVTKKNYFQEWTSKKFFDPHVSCRPARVTPNQHIFKSGLTLIFFILVNYYLLNCVSNKKR